MRLWNSFVRALPWWMKTDFRHNKPLYYLCALEFPFTVATLALYGIADPDTYRTALWTEGSRNGWNSDPIEILYSYANYKPMQPPLPWNQFTTDFNVVICVLSMFMLLFKTVLFIMHALPPFFAAVLHAGLSAVYALSIYHQLGSDYSDPAHPSTVPWMFTHGCGPPASQVLKSFCIQAQASLAVAAMQCALDFSFLCYSLFNAVPTKQQKNEAQAEAESEKLDDKRFEMGQWPQTPASPQFPMSPTTPRTRAFQTLDGSRGFQTLDGRLAAARGPNRDLPLRQHISMGDK